MKKIRLMMATVLCLAMLGVGSPASAFMPCGGAGIDWMSTVQSLIDSIKDMIAQTGKTDVVLVGEDALAGVHDSLSREGLAAGVTVVTSFGKGRRVVGLNDGTIVVLDAAGRIEQQMSGGYAISYLPKP